MTDENPWLQYFGQRASARTLNGHLAPLPLAVRGAVLRCDVSRGGFIAGVLGIGAAVAVASVVPVMVSAFVADPGVVSLALAYALGCGAAFGIVGSWLWHPLSWAAWRIRVAGGAGEPLGGEAEVLVRVPGAIPRGSVALWVLLSAAALADSFVALSWRAVLLRVGAERAHVWLWPVMVMAALLTLGAIGCLLIDGLRRVRRFGWLVGGRQHLTMRHPWSNGARIHDVQVLSGSAEIMVLADGCERSIEVVGLHPRAALQYSRWLIDRLSFRPSGYRTHPDPRSHDAERVEPR